jgi:glycosyltransferase involved in cell wall biosynthesis
MPRVSVVTPIYNSRDFLPPAVESVLAQTYPDWELLLADDGSKDGSAELARDYARRHPGRIIYLEHEGHRNRGVSATRNLAIRHARGEYLALLDADDVWLPEKLAQQVKAADAHPEAGLVYGQALYIDPAGQVLSFPPCGEGEAHRLTWYFDRLIRRPSFLPASSVVFRRSLLNGEGPFDEGLCYQTEDWLLWCHLAHRAPFYFLPTPLIYYRLHRGSFIHQLDQYKVVRAYAEWFDHLFRGAPPWADQRRSVGRDWARGLLPAAHYYAENGQRGRALRIMLLLTSAFDPSVIAYGNFHKACVKLLLGRRGFALFQRLRNRPGVMSGGIAFGPRV